MNTPGGPRVRNEPRTRVVIILTHVPIAPPRAGNEYRMSRLVHWLRREGYRVVLLWSPLPGEEPNPERRKQVAKQVDDLLLCDRQGELIAILKDNLLGSEAELKTAYQRGNAVSRFDINCSLERKAWLQETERTYCPDSVLSLARFVTKRLGRAAFVSEYVFCSKALLHLPEGTLRLIDTHDVFSSKAELVAGFGIRNTQVLTPDEERQFLLRADLILAIQPDEGKLLSRLVPERQVINVPVDFTFGTNMSSGDRMPSDELLFIGSDNPMNVKGLEELLQFAWPRILRRRPDAHLTVVGNVSRFVDARVPRVTALGPVSDLAPVYDRACVILNPAVAGTGLKIKVVEAFAYGRTVVCWPSGIAGLPQDLAHLCNVATSWVEFASLTVAALARQRLPSAHAVQAARLAPFHADAVYRHLGTALRRFFNTSVCTLQ